MNVNTLPSVVLWMERERGERRERDIEKCVTAGLCHNYVVDG